MTAYVDEWHRLGEPTFELDERLATLLIFTDPREVVDRDEEGFTAKDDAPLPFPVFVIHLPFRYLGFRKIGVVGEENDIRLIPIADSQPVRASQGRRSCKDQRGSS